MLTFDLQVVKFDYGHKDSNPVELVHFYRKSSPDVVAETLAPEEVSHTLTKVYQEKCFRVYCKKNDAVCCKAAEQ